MRLPAEITPFERSYLRRMNRIALVFFWAHLPVFVAVACVNDTGPLSAAWMTLLVLVGPTVAFRALDNPRAMGVVSGVTAMAMGALLVHFGQGPMQIEMHFYFFVLLALLAVFANPTAILAAAVTVAAHHAIFWLWLPRSVFNYDASFWTVAVHALFVVLESVAACFVARSFFDDVIGLDRIVQRRTAEIAERSAAMRLVLDTVDQGLVTVDRDGILHQERSAAVERWLGPLRAETTIWDALEPHDAQAASWLRLGWSDLFEDVLPPEVVIDQLPKRARVGARHLSIGYRVLDGNAVQGQGRVLVVLSDETAAVERARAEAEQREMLAMLERIGADRHGFVDFVRDAERLVTAACDDAATPPDVLRALHTLKGNSAFFGAVSLVELSHGLEEAVRDEARSLDASERAALREAWASLVRRLSVVLQDGMDTRLEVGIDDVDRVLEQLAARARHVDIARMVTRLTFEPVARRFTRFGEQARSLARRLGRAEPRIALETGDVRLPPERWAGFWSAFVHVVRNAVDHGLESESERVAAGKSPAANLAMRASVTGDTLVLEVSDDGRGIDWERVARKASGKGLPHATHEELVAALFTDGFSTRDEATETSGRGVGLGAVREAVSALHGAIEIASAVGAGTTFRFRFPLAEALRPSRPLHERATLTQPPSAAA
jgi:signal transduction histidine kinase